MKVNIEMEKHDKDIIELFFQIAKKQGHLKLDPNLEITKNNFTVFRGSLYKVIEDFLTKKYGNTIHRDKIDEEKKGLWKKYFNNKKNKHKTKIEKFELDNLIIGREPIFKMYNSTLKQLNPEHKRVIAWYLGFLDYDDIGVDLGEGEDSTLQKRLDELFKEPIENELLGESGNEPKAVLEKELDKNPFEELSIYLKSCEENALIDVNKALNHDLTINENFNLDEKLQRFIDFCSKSRSELHSLLPPSAKEVQLGNFFNKIASAKKLNTSHTAILNEILGDDERGNGYYKWHHRSLIASALTISIMRHYHGLKADYLIRLVVDNESELNSDVWQKALVGLVLGLLKNYKDEKSTLKLREKLKEISEIGRVKESVRHIVLKIINYTFESYNTNISESEYFNETYKCFIPFYEDSEILTEAFRNNQVNIDTELFAKLFTGSALVTNIDKHSIALNYSTYSKENILLFYNGFQAESQNTNFSKKHQPEVVLRKKYSKILNELYFIINDKKDLSDIVIDKLSTLETEIDEFLGVISDTFNETLTRAVIADKYKNFTLAIQDYIWSATNGHETEWAWGMAGSVYKRIDRNNDAISCYKKVEEINPINIQNLVDLGICFIRLGNCMEAERYFNKYVELFPENQNDILEIGKLFFDSGYYQNAINYFIKINEIESPDYLQHIGYSFQELGNIEKALEYYRTEEQNNPNNVWFIEHIGWCLLEKKEYKKALKYYKRAAEIDPNDIHYQYGIGRCLSEQGDYNSAIFYHYKAEKISPNNVFNLKQIGWCLQNENDHVMATYSAESGHPFRKSPDTFLVNYF